MADGPSIRRIKREKRNLPVELAPSGISRRRFLTFLGTGSAALAAGSAGVLTGCAKSEEQGSANQGSQHSESAPAGGETAGSPSFFEAIEPSDKDDLVLPKGFRYEIIRSAGDPLGGDLTYGDHNDFVAYFPIDVLKAAMTQETASSGSITST